jgi:hypothetical protein
MNEKEMSKLTFHLMQVWGHIQLATTLEEALMRYQTSSDQAATRSSAPAAGKPCGFTNCSGTRARIL